MTKVPLLVDTTVWIDFFAGKRNPTTAYLKEYITDFNGQIQITIKTTETLTLKVQSLGFNELSLKTNELSTFNDLSLSPL